MTAQRPSAHLLGAIRCLITDSTWELPNSAAHPCPHVPCRCGSQKGKCLHHTYGAVESKDRGWISQFCSAPCSREIKEYGIVACSKGLLMGTLASAGSSSSLSRAAPAALPKCYTVLDVPRLFPMRLWFYLLHYTSHYQTLLTPSSVYTVFHFAVKLVKKNFYVLSQILSTSTPLGPSNLFWSYFCHQFYHILCQLRPITKLLKCGALLR